MSTLEKEPLAAPGASDLLDSLVQDHLQRAAAPRETPEQAAAALGANLLGAPAERPALAEAPGANDGAGRLQQEIASLLAGDPHADAPKEPAPLADAAQHTLTVDPFADFPTAAPPIEQVPTKPGMNVPTANVSSAELEMLLASPDHDPASDDLTAPVEEPSAAEAVRAELAADAGGPTQIQQPITASSDATDEVAAKLSEADGVMAQELAQLMNEKPSAANASAPAAANPMPPELAAAVQNIMNNPVQTAERAADAPAAPTEITPTPDAPTPETPIAQTGANVVAALDTLAETTPHPHAAAPNILARTWRLFTGIFVMMLQIIDMPFGWIKEPDKNVLGMAALLLLLGGALLKALSWWMEHH